MWVREWLQAGDRESVAIDVDVVVCFASLLALSLFLAFLPPFVSLCPFLAESLVIDVFHFFAYFKIEIPLSFQALLSLPVEFPFQIP